MARIAAVLLNLAVLAFTAGFLVNLLAFLFALGASLAP